MWLTFYVMFLQTYIPIATAILVLFSFIVCVDDGFFNLIQQQWKSLPMETILSGLRFISSMICSIHEIINIYIEPILG